MKAMAHAPADRYDTATAMLYDMDEFRKNPAMLFDYNAPPLDDVTRIHRPPLTAPEKPVQTARTTAERVAAGKTDPSRSAGNRGTAGERTASRSTGANRTPARTGAGSRGASVSRSEARRRREEEQAEENRNRAATIAIIVGSIVAIIAIAILLITLFGGGTNGPEEEMVVVPSLIGEDYESIKNQYEDFDIQLGDKVYNEKYPSGQIFDQNPAGGDKVIKGSRIVVTVSLGEEPQAMIMENLVELDKQAAIDFLVGQGVERSRILVREEKNDEVETGKVIRTEPAAEAEIAEDQTVTLWVSSGPLTITEKMPNVEGRSYEEALKELTDLGFHNVEPEYLESKETKGNVIGQSVERNEEIDVDTPIILQVSKGLKMPDVLDKSYEEAFDRLTELGFTNVEPEYVPSEEPEGQVLEQSVNADEEIDAAARIVLKVSEGPTEPTTAPPAPVAKVVTFYIPEDMIRPCVFELRYNGQVVFQKTLQEGEALVEVELTGNGVQYYDKYIDDVYWEPEKVDFGS